MACAEGVSLALPLHSKVASGAESEESHLLLSFPRQHDETRYSPTRAARLARRVSSRDSMAIIPIPSYRTRGFARRGSNIHEEQRDKSKDGKGVRSSWSEGAAKVARKRGPCRRERHDASCRKTFYIIPEQDLMLCICYASSSSSPLVGRLSICSN